MPTFTNVFGADPDSTQYDTVVGIVADKNDLPTATSYEDGVFAYVLGVDTPADKGWYETSGGSWVASNLNLAGDFVEQSDVGAASGVASLDGATEIVERLSYEGDANGVAELDGNGRLPDGQRAQSVVDHVGSSANPHSVTAAQAGAVPDTGGTFTGSVTFENDSGTSTVTNKANSVLLRFHETDETDAGIQIALIGKKFIFQYRLSDQDWTLVGGDSWMRYDLDTRILEVTPDGGAEFKTGSTFDGATFKTGPVDFEVSPTVNAANLYVRDPDLTDDAGVRLNSREGVGAIVPYDPATPGWNFQREIIYVTADQVWNVEGDLEVAGRIVADRGATADGEFVRFYDGTQMCWGSHALTLSGGSSVETTGVESFPTGFSDTPRGSLSLKQLSGNNNGREHALHWYQGYPSSTAFRIGVVGAAGNTTTTAGDIEIVWSAVGRWY